MLNNSKDFNTEIKKIIKFPLNIKITKSISCILQAEKH